MEKLAEKYGQIEFKRFLELFLLNSQIELYIEQTYVSMSEISETLDLLKYHKYIITILKILDGEKLFEYGVVGLPASGKTFLSELVKTELQIGTFPTDDLVKELNLSFGTLDPKNFPALIPDSEHFKRYEYKTAVCMILSGMCVGKMVDFGGPVFVQPGLIVLVQNAIKKDLINLEIQAEDRVANQVQDYISFHDDGLRRTMIKRCNSLLESSESGAVKFQETRSDYVRVLGEFSKLKSARARLEILMLQYMARDLVKLKLVEGMFKISAELDTSRIWRQSVFNRVAKPTDFRDSCKRLGVNHE